VDGPDGAEGLLAAAEGLAAQEVEDRPARARESRVRRKQRVVRGRDRDGAAILNVDDGARDDVGEGRVRVRSLADEPGRVGARPPVDPAKTAVAQPADAPGSDQVMLDAGGNEITAPAAPVHSDAAVLTSAVFLADAVHCYLEGRDELGAEHAVTLDRLATVRRTLERLDVELER
jgi:hypothetical protein